jgi:hypothetical protein
VSAGRLAVAQAHRTPLSIIRGKQRGATETVYSRGEFPAQIYRIGYARIHAVAAGRYVLMRGITCQKHTVRAVALGDE